MAASGRKLPVKLVDFEQFERPLSGKADVQIGILRTRLLHDRLALESGGSRGRVMNFRL